MLSSQIERTSMYNDTYIERPDCRISTKKLDSSVSLYEYINWYKRVSELLKDTDNLVSKYNLNSENLVKNDVVNDGRSYEVFFKDMHDKKHIMQFPEGDYMNLIALAIYRRQNLNDQEKKQWLQTILEKEQNHLESLHKECKAKYINSFKKKFKNDLVFLKKAPFCEVNGHIFEIPNGKMYFKPKYLSYSYIKDAYKQFCNISNVKEKQREYHYCVKESLLKYSYGSMYGVKVPIPDLMTDISKQEYDPYLRKLYKKRTKKELALNYDSARAFVLSDPTILNGLKAIKDDIITTEKILGKLKFSDSTYNDSLKLLQNAYNRNMSYVEEDLRDMDSKEIFKYLDHCGLYSREIDREFDKYAIKEKDGSTSYKIRDLVEAAFKYANTEVKYKISDGDLYYYFNDSICYSINPYGNIDRTIKKLSDGRWSLFEGRFDPDDILKGNKGYNIIVFNKKTPFEVLPYVPCGSQNWENFKKLGMADFDELISYGFVDMKGMFWLKDSMKKRDYTESACKTLGRIKRKTYAMYGGDNYVWEIWWSNDSWLYENPTIVGKDGFPTNNIEDYVLAEGTNYVTGTSYREGMEIEDYDKLAKKVEDAMVLKLENAKNPVYYDIERNYGHAVAEECRRNNYEFYKGMPKDLVLNNLAAPKFIRSDSRGNSVYEYYGTYYYFRNGKLDHWTAY